MRGDEAEVERKRLRRFQDSQRDSGDEKILRPNTNTNTMIYGTEQDDSKVHMKNKQIRKSRKTLGTERQIGGLATLAVKIFYKMPIIKTMVLVQMQV